MTTIPCSPTEVTALRHDAQLCGITLSPTIALKLLRKVRGDRSLCMDALLMKNRPDWLTEIVGAKK